MRSHHSLGRREAVKFGGIGIVDSDRDVYNDREYSVWYDMLIRCNPPNWDEKPKLASYRGATVGESFRNYSDFHSWLYERWIPNANLDKDIRIRGNKVYSAETCLVVSARTNKAFQLKSRESELPYGVKARPGGKFAAYGFNLDGTYHAKHFSDPLSAHRYWQTSKAKLLIHLAYNESDEARPFILKRANMLLNDASNGIITKENI